MQCSNCQFQNMPGVQTCGRCGASLQLASLAIDVHPPRASRAAKRWRRWFPIARMEPVSRCATLPAVGYPAGRPICRRRRALADDRPGWAQYVGRPARAGGYSGATGAPVLGTAVLGTGWAGCCWDWRFRSTRRQSWTSWPHVAFSPAADLLGLAAAGDPGIIRPAAGWWRPANSLVPPLAETCADESFRLPLVRSATGYVVYYSSPADSQVAGSADIAISAATIESCRRRVTSVRELRRRQPSPWLPLNPQPVPDGLDITVPTAVSDFPAPTRCFRMYGRWQRFSRSSGGRLLANQPLWRFGSIR